jgi:hypothetical protein
MTPFATGENLAGGFFCRSGKCLADRTPPASLRGYLQKACLRIGEASHAAIGIIVRSRKNFSTAETE